MNNIKVRAKLTIVMIVSVLALAICTYLSIVNMDQLQTKALDVIEEDARSSYDEEIRQQVENVISLCQNIYDKYQAGEFTEQEAKKLAADEIRALRYGDNGYFWVDQYDGTNVVLLGSATEGTNRMETKDADCILQGYCARIDRPTLLFADNAIPLRERAGDEKSAWLPRYPSLYIL